MELKAVKEASTYIIQSQEEELRRIALELHEGISQNLYGLYTGLEFIQLGINEPAMNNYAKEMSALMNRTIQEVRHLATELYPMTMTNIGLSSAIKNYISSFTSTSGIAVQINSKGNERSLTESQSLAVFRACQEAFVNMAKYADSSSASIYFTWEEKSLTIEIEDHGRGFDLQEAVENNRFKGIAAIKQRLELAGGHCQLSSKLDKGTKVSIFLPIEGAVIDHTTT